MEGWGPTECARACVCLCVEGCDVSQPQGLRMETRVSVCEKSQINTCHHPSQPPHPNTHPTPLSDHLLISQRILLSGSNLSRQFAGNQSIRCPSWKR